VSELEVKDVETPDPDRPGVFDRSVALCLAVVSFALFAGSVGFVVYAGLHPGPDEGTEGFVAGAVLLAFWLHRRTGLAWAMWRSPGRYVFVDRRERVRYSSGRWGAGLLPTGHWVHLTDVATGVPLGWIEVTRRAAHALDEIGVCALFGDPSRPSRAVITGPFSPVLPFGRTFVDLPAPYSGGGRQSISGRWRLPRGPSLPT
jgi:hypothetical protein